MQSVIGFVGLIIPHAVRMIVGTDHKKLIPISVLVGAIFMVLADILARIIIPNAEMPIGILISMIGAPVFIYLMVKRSYGFGGAQLMNITAENIKMKIGDNEILKGVSIDSKSSEFVGIIGPNGSGKSTLLKSIYRILKPNDGCIKLG